jgi:hypothetical protein
MNRAMRLLVVTMSLLGGIALEGCGLVRNVMSSSYHIATEPVRIVQRGVTRPTSAATTTTTTTTVTKKTTIAASDVTVPGHPVVKPSPAPKRTVRQSAGRSKATGGTPAPKVARKEAGSSKVPAKGTKPPATTSSPQATYPTAKPVPGKPGYVFSPFDSKGRYVDVSGYAPGSKVKDPWTDKIFVVP